MAVSDTSINSVNKPQGATLTQGPVKEHLVTLTVPLIWGIAATMTFNIADTWFVAQLGEAELAAMSFTFPVVMVLISVGIGMMAGTSSIIARVMGQGDMERVRKLTTHATLLSILISIIFTALGLLTMDWVFMSLGADEQTMPLIRDYMEIWYYGFIFILVPMVALGAVRATGDSKLQSNIMIISSIVNIILDPLLIFGLMGFPQLGIEGAAIATVFARGLSFFMGYWALHYKKRIVDHSIPNFSELWLSWKSVMHVALPATGTNVLIPFAGSIIVALVATFGTNAVAGFGAATKVEQFTLVIFYAMSAMIGPFVGQNLGAGQHDRIFLSIKLCVKFCLMIGLVIAVILGVFAFPIIGLFSDHEGVIKAGVWYLWIAPISFGMEGVVMLINAAFNGIGRPLPGVAISTIRMFILYLPISYLLSRPYGLQGVFIGALVANLLSGALAIGWFRRCCRNSRSE